MEGRKQVITMKKTINYKNLKGQTVCVYEPYANGGEVEKTLKVCSVTSVGPKYITAGGIKFDKEMLTNHDCGTRQLFIGSPEEFRSTLYLRKSLFEKLERLQSGIGNMELGELEELETYLKRILDEPDTE